ncbi:MAG: flagellar protein FliT [Lachnospiraceae bacterium]|nr:flagellar protein FliT [Lachnospiraceae bacterium]
MSNTYITALTESLEKKIEVLNKIHEKDEEQLSIAKTEPFSFEAFDKNVEEKDVLIYKLVKLDEGFEIVYENVKAELNANKDLYKEEIKKMQKLITDITALSTKIQAEEARNKAAMEAAFRNEKQRLKSSRSSVKAVNSYAKAMRSGTGSNFSGISGIGNDWN